MLDKLKDWWLEFNTCKMDSYFNALDKSMQGVIDRCIKIEKQLDEEIALLTEEVAAYKGMINSIAETIPDMMWCKDLEGNYVFANTTIRTGLLFDHDPLGKNDLQLSLKAKEIFGANNHTFGEVCGNSDAVVIEKTMLGIFKKEDGRFLESGKVKGKMVYLEVYKAPWIVNGELRGVVGTGRDMTPYVEAYREQNCSGCGKMADIFKKYEYEGVIDARMGWN